MASCRDLYVDKFETRSEDQRKSLLGRINAVLDKGSATERFELDSKRFLHEASADGNVDAVHLLLKRGAGVSFPNSYCQMPLYHAAMYGHEKIVQMLLEHGADANSEDMRGYTPLNSSIFKRQWKMARFLLQQGGARVNNKNFCTLDFAVQHGTAEFVKLMLQHGADASVVNRYGRTPLCEALCSYGQVSPQMFSALVRAHPSAVHMLKLEQLQKLVWQFPGALRAVNEAGDLPLHEACRNGVKPEVVVFMAEQDTALARETNLAGRLPLHEACLGQSTLEVIEWLEGLYPEALSAADAHGRLPLHLACMSRRVHYYSYHIAVDALKFLVQQNGSAMGACDQHGKIPLDYACETDAPLDLIYELLRKNPVETFGSLSTLKIPRMDEPAKKKSRRS